MLLAITFESLIWSAHLICTVFFNERRTTEVDLLSQTCFCLSGCRRRNSVYAICVSDVGVRCCLSRFSLPLFLVFAPACTILHLLSTSLLMASSCTPEVCFAHGKGPFVLYLDLLDTLSNQRELGFLSCRFLFLYHVTTGMYLFKLSDLLVVS